MNHKKIIALSAVISMLAFGGCSSEKETESTDIPAAAEVTAAMSSEVGTEASSETNTEASAETEAAPASGISAEEAYSAKNGESWTDRVMKSANSWEKGNVVYKCTAMDGDDIATEVEMSLYDKKAYINTEVPGLMTMTIIIDGDKCYMLDKPSKCYAIDTENTYDADSEVESLVDTTADYSVFAEDGIENIDGVDYIYEKFTKDDFETAFYFSPEGRLLKMRVEEMIADMTIDMLDSPDESCFVIPEDYTEVSMEELSMKMMAGLMGAMEEFSEDTSEAE